MSMLDRGLRVAALAACALLLGGCPGGGTSDQAHRDADAVQVPPSENAVPSCYAAVDVGVPAPAPHRALFILVDQTTGLDDRLRQTLRSNLERLLQPGTSFTIATFSAFSRGHYAAVAATGAIETPLSEEQRLHLPASKVEPVGECLGQQRAFAIQIASQHLAEATSASSSTFTHSEIMASLRHLSEAVRASPARDKLVILVSDLLEHSTVTSFYANREIRPIDTEEELRKAGEHELLADFEGARLAVIGAGLLSPDSEGQAVRPTRALNALRHFWEQWFERSRADLVGYGQPDLAAPLSWRGAQAPSG